MDHLVAEPPQEVALRPDPLTEGGDGRKGLSGLQLGPVPPGRLGRRPRPAGVQFNM